MTKNDFRIIVHGFQLNRASDLITTSLYSNYIDQWLNVFPRDRIHIVNGDNLIREPWTEIAKVQDFLGIDREVDEDNFEYVKSKGFFCLRRSESDEAECLRDKKGRRHPKANKKVEKKLRSFFRPFNKELYRKIEVDFGWK